MSKDVLKSSPVTPRDWQSLLAAYEVSAPYNYVVMDDFLQPDICKQLHQDLLNHTGWCYQKSMEQALISNMNPDIEIIFTIADSIRALCPSLLSNYKLIEHWALMYQGNTSGKAHSDIGALTLNLWLTPEQYNMEPSGGGLVFFDVKRASEVVSDESFSYLFSEQYLKDHTRDKKICISYKYNRALLFDARTFHETDTFRFTNTKPESYRINLSLAFDNPEVYYKRVDSLKEALANKNDT